jgi:hypothetical protein
MLSACLKSHYELHTLYYYCMLTSTCRFVLWNPPLSNFAAQSDPTALVPDTTGCLPIRKSRAKKRTTAAASATTATAASSSGSAKRSRKGAAALTSAEAAEVRGARPIVAQDNHYDRYTVALTYIIVRSMLCSIQHLNSVCALLCSV